MHAATFPLPAAAVVRQHLALPEGRVLGYGVYGSPNGRPLLFFHGFPGSHLQAALVHEQAAAAGIALVAFDRAGFGDSDAAPQPTVEATVDDVARLADALGLHRFGVIGVSCGGPHALACARRLPDRVTAVGLLAGAGPMQSQPAREGQLPVLRAMFALARRQPRWVWPLLALDAALFRIDAERAVTALSSMFTAPDRELLERDLEVRRRFGASLAAAYRRGTAGALGEVQRIAAFGAEDLQGIDQPVQVFQGEHDRHVRPAAGRDLAAALRHGQLHLCPDDGHLSVVVTHFAHCAKRVLQTA